MSAAASAEMIETPPVLNFEEIDYKEIEVEEVSEGPAVPLAPRARPAWPRQLFFSPAPALRCGGVRRGFAGAPGCRDPPVCLTGGSVLPWMLQRLAPANKGGLAGSGGASLLLPALLLDALLWSFV